MGRKNFEESNLLIDLGDNQESKDNIWIDEKDKREESIIKFISDFAYDGYYFSEFDVPGTGGDITIMRKVKEENLGASSISCFYKNNEITEIKVRFEDASGKFMEVLMSGNVVKDYIFLNE